MRPIPLKVLATPLRTNHQICARIRPLNICLFSFHLEKIVTELPPWPRVPLDSERVTCKLRAATPRKLPCIDELRKDRRACIFVLTGSSAADSLNRIPKRR